MFSRIAKVLMLVLALGVVLACAPSLVPFSAPAPTYDPNSINTVIVQTANAAATQTALVVSPTATPTNTPPPTFTPSVTPSPTITFIFILATPTVPSSTPEPGSSGKLYDCRVVSMDPVDGSRINPNTSFTMIWNVMNMGSEAWDSNNADYHYKSGNKLHKQGAYDLEVSVPTGGQTEIRVAMKSPDSNGTYSTTWVIKSGQTEFCKMSVTIQVP